MRLLDDPPNMVTASKKSCLNYETKNGTDGGYLIESDPTRKGAVAILNKMIGGRFVVKFGFAFE